VKAAALYRSELHPMGASNPITGWRAITPATSALRISNISNGVAQPMYRFRLTFCAICLVALVGCQTVKSSHCRGFDAIPPSQAQIDVMTPAEKERALAELLKFERICGERP
jgi:hypothetical protein